MAKAEETSKPVTVEIPAGEAHERLAELMSLAEFGEKHVCITRRGKRAVYILGVAQYDALTAA